MARLERDYQPKVIKKIQRMLPGCLVLKNDSAYRQGIPDWVIFYEDRWAMLEIKRQRPTSRDFEPNQEWYIDHLDNMSFCACIYPENEKEVLSALQSALSSRRNSRVP